MGQINPNTYYPLLNTILMGFMKAFFFKHKLLFFHLIFWILLISYRLFDMTRFLSLERALMYFGMPTAFNILISYLHYFLILPYLFEKKNLLKYLVFLVLSLGVFMLLRFQADAYFLAPVSRDQEYYASFHFARILSVLWGFLSFIVITAMIKLAVNWFDLESKRKQLENEKLTAELNYLKSQINPHFLFNTLHNLNYLALSKDDATSSVIIKLSNIMRYMIYEVNKESVPISKEIQYMKDYIELERIRLNKPFRIDFQVSKEVEEVNIAPLLLFTCLENAFKHGVSDKQGNCWIKVSLALEGKKLVYKVSNSKVLKMQPASPSGFGLKNLKKRLELHYPNLHTLNIEETDDSFWIHLIIDKI